MKNGCHYWHGCGTDYIDTFKPNYIMFNAKYSANGGPYLETERLKKYIAKNNMYLIETLHSLDADNIAISVYKK
jgi:hypothetical protein